MASFSTIVPTADIVLDGSKQIQALANQPVGGLDHENAVTQNAIKAGAVPSQLAWARENMGRSDFVNWCEKFVENAFGTTGQYPSAIAAAHAAQQNGTLRTDLANMQPGDKVYYDAAHDNGGYGHAALYNGGGTVVSSAAPHPTPLQGYFGGQLLGYIPQAGGSQAVPGLAGAPLGATVPPSGSGVATTPSSTGSPLDQSPAPQASPSSDGSNAFMDWVSQQGQKAGDVASAVGTGAHDAGNAFMDWVAQQQAPPPTAPDSGQPPPDQGNGDQGQPDAGLTMDAMQPAPDATPPQEPTIDPMSGATGNPLQGVGDAFSALGTAAKPAWNEFTTGSQSGVRPAPITYTDDQLKQAAIDQKGLPIGGYGIPGMSGAAASPIYGTPPEGQGTTATNAAANAAGYGSYGETPLSKVTGLGGALPVLGDIVAGAGMPGGEAGAAEGAIPKVADAVGEAAVPVSSRLAALIAAREQSASEAVATVFKQTYDSAIANGRSVDDAITDGFRASDAIRRPIETTPPPDLGGTATSLPPVVKTIGPERGKLLLQPQDLQGAEGYQAAMDAVQPAATRPVDNGGLIPRPPSVPVTSDGLPPPDIRGDLGVQKVQQGLDMLARQATPIDQTGDTLGLRIQRAFADRNAAANQVSGNALDQIAQQVKAGNILPEEAGAIRDSVNAEAKLGLMAGAPAAAAQKVDETFRPIYDLVEGKTFTDATGQQQPLQNLVDLYAKYKTDADRLAQGPRMASAGVNSVVDAVQGMTGVQKLAGEDWPIVQQADLLRQQAMNGLREDMVQGGLWTQEQANEFVRNAPNYNPVRVAQYFDDMLKPRGSLGSGQGDDLIRGLTETGSPMDTQPALQSAMQSVFQGNIAIQRNAANQAIIQAAKLDPGLAGLIKPVAADEPNMAKAIVTQKATDALDVIRGAKPPTGVGAGPANTITFLNNGQSETWQVPKVLADVANGLTAAQVSGVGKVLGAMNAPIRVMSTVASPTFVLSRAVWNAAFGWFKTGANPLSAIGGMKSAALKDAVYQAYIAAGGGMGHAEVGASAPGIVGKAMQTTGQSLEQMVTRTGGMLIKDKGQTNVGATLGQLFTAAPIKRANEVINMGPRLAEYQRQLAGGATDAEAALAGRRVVTDFSRGGQLTQELSQPMLFLNDHVRGILDVGRTLRDNPASRVRLAVLTGAAVGAYAWNKQFGDQYQDVPQYVRDQNLVFMLPNSQPGDLHYVALPLRNLAAPKIAVDAILGHLDKTSQSDLGQIIWSMIGSASPVAGDYSGPGNAALSYGSSMLGQIPKTAVEEVTNRDFFRNQPIVPQQQIDEHLPPSLQVSPSTSLAARGIGAALGNVPGLAPEASSPKRIDYALQAFTGSGGRLASEGLSTLAGQPANTPPVVGGLLSGINKTSGGQLAQNAYDQRDQGMAQLEQQNRGLYEAFGQLGTAIQPPRGTITYSGVKIPLLPQDELAYQQARIKTLNSFFKNPDTMAKIAAMPLASRQAILNQYMAAANQVATGTVLQSIGATELRKRIEASQAGSTKSDILAGRPPTKPDVSNVRFTAPAA